MRIFQPDDKTLPNEHINLPGIDPSALPAGPPPPLPHAPVQPISGQTPLTPQQLTYLQAAGDSYRIIRKTANVARFSGVTSLILGVGAAGCLGISHDFAGILATLVLLAVGTVELVGRHRLLAGSPDALKLLALNQLAFLGAIAIYCGVQIATFSTKSLNQSLSAELRDAGLGGTDVGTLIDPRMAQSVNTSVYGLVLLISIASQGGLAWYYMRRRKHLEAYLSAEPWQRDLLQKVSR